MCVWICLCIFALFRVLQFYITVVAVGESRTNNEIEFNEQFERFCSFFALLDSSPTSLSRSDRFFCFCTI